MSEETPPQEGTIFDHVEMYHVLLQSSNGENSIAYLQMPRVRGMEFLEEEGGFRLYEIDFMSIHDHSMQDDYSTVSHKSSFERPRGPQNKLTDSAEVSLVFRYPECEAGDSLAAIARDRQLILMAVPQAEAESITLIGQLDVYKPWKLYMSDKRTEITMEYSGKLPTL